MAIKRASKWSDEAVITDAKKYATIKEWREHSSAYGVAHRRNLLTIATAHMSPNNKPKYSAEEIISDAKKYKSIAEWVKFNKKFYEFAKKNNLHEEATRHMERLNEIWTEEKIIEEAKKYKTKREWSEKSSRSYHIAHSRKIVDKVTGHMMKILSYGEMVIYKYLLERDIRFIHQHRFNDLSNINKLRCDFYVPDFNLVIEYNGAQHKKGWNQKEDSLNQIKNSDSIKINYLIKNSINLLIIEAKEETEIVYLLENELSTISIRNSTSFNPVIRKLTEKEIDTIENLGSWSKQDVFESARSFTSYTKWQIEAPSAYNRSRQMGWLDEAANHLKRGRKPNDYWTKDVVHNSALKFKTIKEWQETDGYSPVVKARRMGWIDEVTSHMKIKKIKSFGYWNKENVMKSAAAFNSFMEWNRNERSAVQSAYENGWMDEIHEKVFGRKK